MNYFDSNKFSERASQLFGATGQKEISMLTGISQAVISSIKTKSIKSPSADTIYSIARSYNVSTDWLLGLTDVKSTDKATKELCGTLGLSEKTIETLKAHTRFNNTIDFIIEQDAFIKNHKAISSADGYFSILENLSQFIELVQATEEKDTYFKIAQNGEIVKGQLKYDARELFETDILGVEFENEIPLSPVFSLYGVRMQDALNKIIAQLQNYINEKELPEYKKEV